MQVLQENNTMLAQELITNQSQLSAATSELAALKETTKSASRERKLEEEKDKQSQERELEGSAIGRSEGK